MSLISSINGGTIAAIAAGNKSAGKSPDALPSGSTVISTGRATLTLNALSQAFTSSFRRLDIATTGLLGSQAVLTQILTIADRLVDYAEKAASQSVSDSERETIDQQFHSSVQELKTLLKDSSAGNFDLRSVEDIKTLLEQAGVNPEGTSTLARYFSQLGNGDDQLGYSRVPGENVSVSERRTIPAKPGDFSHASLTAVSSGISKIAAGDLDENGTTDIIVPVPQSNHAGTTAVVLSGNNDGTLTAGTSINTGRNPISSAVADVDNDGHLDVAVLVPGSTAENVDVAAGLAETTELSVPTSGSVAVSTIEFGAASTKEVTLVKTAPVAAPGVQEKSTITPGAVGSKSVDAITVTGDSSTVTGGDYWEISSNNQSYYIWYTVDDVGDDPAVSGKTGVQVDLSSDTSSDDIALATANAITATAEEEFDVAVSGSTITLTTKTLGQSLESSSFTGLSGGTLSLESHTDGASSAIQAGQHFSISSPTGSHQFYFTIDSEGADPGGATAIALNSGDSAETVASQIAQVVGDTDGTGSVFTTEVNSEGDVEVTNVVSGAATDINGGTTTLATAVVTQGSGSSTGIEAGQYFTLSSVGTDYYVWFSVDSSGDDPAVSDRTGIQVDLAAGDDANAVATKVGSALEAIGDFSVEVENDEVSITDGSAGAVVDGSAGTVAGPFAVSVTTQGSPSGYDPVEGVGPYFTIDTPDENFYVWFTLNGEGTDPGAESRTGIQVDLQIGDSADTVAAAVRDAISAADDFDVSLEDATLQITNHVAGPGSAEQGTTSGLNITAVAAGESSGIVSGDHFLISSADTDYYVWFNLDDGGNDPAIAGRTGIEIPVTTGTSREDLAAATASAIDALDGVSSTSDGETVSIVSEVYGDITDSDSGSFSDIGLTVQQGQSSGVDIDADSLLAFGHGFGTGDEVQVSSTGDLPDGLFADQSYYIISIDDDKVQLAASEEDALNGVAIDFSSVGSGTHTIIPDINGKLKIFLGDGSGGLGDPTSLNLDTSPSGFALGDFNGDDSTDIATVDSVTNELSIRLNNGDGTFADPVAYDVGAGPGPLSVGDFNADGFDDIAAANSEDGTVSIFFGAADGSLEEQTLVSSEGTTSSVLVSDIDSDGFDDLVAADSIGGTLEVYRGSGEGTFGYQGSVQVGPGIVGITAADYNSDGRYDLAAVTANQLSVSFQDRFGLFGAPTNYSVGSGTTSLVSADFNSDGKLDLASSASTSGNIEVRLNTTEPSRVQITRDVFDGTANEDPLSQSLLTRVEATLAFNQLTKLRDDVKKDLNNLTTVIGELQGGRNFALAGYQAAVVGSTQIRNFRTANDLADYLVTTIKQYAHDTSISAHSDIDRTLAQSLLG